MTKQEEIREGIRTLLKGYHIVANAVDDGIEPDMARLDTYPDRIMYYLHSQGVVIKVKRKLPEPPQEPPTKLGDDTGWAKFVAGSPKEIWKMALEASEEADIVAVEPLIKEVNNGKTK